MTMRLLTDDDVSFIANALRCAADQYKQHAANADFDARLREQFERQEQKARDWADTFEQATDPFLTIEEDAGGFINGILR